MAILSLIPNTLLHQSYSQTPALKTTNTLYTVTMQHKSTSHKHESLYRWNFCPSMSSVTITIAPGEQMCQEPSLSVNIGMCVVVDTYNFCGSIRQVAECPQAVLHQTGWLVCEVHGQSLHAARFYDCWFVAWTHRQHCWEDKCPIMSTPITFRYHQYTVL